MVGSHSKIIHDKLGIGYGHTLSDQIARMLLTQAFSRQDKIVDRHDTASQARFQTAEVSIAGKYYERSSQLTVSRSD